MSKQLLANLEKAAERYEAWTERRSPGHVAAMRQFMQQMSAQRQQRRKPDPDLQG